MKIKIKTDAVYTASDNVVVRLVENDIILFSVVSGEDDMDNEPYFLNATGQVIWQRLDGYKSLKDIVKNLAAEFKAPVKVIEKDVIGFVEGLIKRKLLVKVLKA
ncbi:hypothetical protein ASZ90_008256 [hydrocarbon metagenome]|uniref:PqqD family protein n=1 Tax=hydrocarbon metagenome TaxID=938273 RepID=A0A0W8FMR3_9ZZZZ